jgi:dTDP-4-dehydrorhamnose reductase
VSKIVVLGSGGLLGSYLYRTGKARGHDIVGISRTASPSVDIAGDATDRVWLEKMILRTKCEVVINALKFKGSTDECERRRDDCWKANFCVPASLASLQNKYDFTLVHMSTDWVFEGKRGVVYDEESLPYPQNFYALSKFAAELAVSRARKYLVLRTTGLFGFEQPPRNFFARLLDANENRKPFDAAADQYSQPISALELSNLVYELLQKNVSDMLLMATGPEYLSRYQFARKVASVLGLDECLIRKVRSAHRIIGIPRYLRVNISKTETLLDSKIKDLSEMVRELGTPPTIASSEFEVLGQKKVTHESDRS